jgi:hypothetical protein
MSNGTSTSTHEQGGRRITCRRNQKLLSRERQKLDQKDSRIDPFHESSGRSCDAIAYAGYTPTNSNSDSTFPPERLRA